MRAIAFIACTLFLAHNSLAQCYVRLDDASGFNTDAYQADLQAAAAKLCAIFDTTGFAGQFKVYDFGFYLHQENTTGGYPEPFAQKIQEVQALSPYYLLFGKQTDRTGVYTRFWVELKMPQTAHFSCMTNLQRDIYGKRVEKVTTDKYFEKGNVITAYYEAEIAGIEELHRILTEIIECCYVGPNNRMPGCEGCTDEIVNEYFDLNGFRKVNLETSTAPFSNINFGLIKDYSFHKVNINGVDDYIGNHLDSLTMLFNTYFSFNLLVTSNASQCIDSISGTNLDTYKTKNDFFCYINTSSGKRIIQGLIFHGILKAILG